jgi:hypothetical protein
LAQRASQAVSQIGRQVCAPCCLSGEIELDQLKAVHSCLLERLALAALMFLLKNKNINKKIKIKKQKALERLRYI